MSFPDSPSRFGLYQHVSQAERERRFDKIFLSHLSEKRATTMSAERKQAEIDHRRALDMLAFQGEMDRQSGLEHIRSVSKINDTLTGLERRQDETRRILNDPDSALNRLAGWPPKISNVTMTVPRNPFRNRIEESPRWIPHTLRAVALITAILYGVSL